MYLAFVSQDALPQDFRMVGVGVRVGGMSARCECACPALPHARVLVLCGRPSQPARRTPRPHTAAGHGRGHLAGGAAGR